MGNPWGTKLSRLIRERAYVSGAIEPLQQEITDIESALASAKAKHAEHLARLQHLDEQIIQLSTINPQEDIRPIRKLARVTQGEYGSFRRELVRLLKEADGPVSVGYLVDRMANMFHLPLETAADRKHSMDLVRKPLNIFRRRGAVERLPTRPGERQGVWRWRYDYDEGDA